MTYTDPVGADTAAGIQLNRLLAEWHQQGHAITLFYCTSVDPSVSVDPQMSERLAPVRKYPLERRDDRPPFRFLWEVPGLARIPDRGIARHRTTVRAIRQHLAAEGGYDFCLSWSKPDSIHLAALAVMRHNSMPWVACLSDPWSDLGSDYAPHGPVVRALNRQLERLVISGADRVIFTTEQTRDLVMQKYPASYRGKAYALVTGFDPTLYRGRRARGGRKVRIKHVGSLYGPRTPEPLFRALALCLAARPELSSEIEVECIGAGEDMVQRMRDAYGIPDSVVRTRPPIPYLASLREMEDTDVLLSIDAPAATNVFLPSKLVDYAGTGNLIWVITSPGASADFAAACGGVVSNVHAPDEIAVDLAQIVQTASVTMSSGESRSPPVMFDIAHTSRSLLDIIRPCLVGGNTQEAEQCIR